MTNYSWMVLSPLRFCTYNESPWIELSSNSAKGFLRDILLYLSDYLSYKLLVPSPPDPGRLTANNTWTGCMGMLHRNEADLGLFPHIATSESDLACANTPAFSFTHTTIVSGVSTVPTYMSPYFVIYPFEPNLWLGLGICLILMPGLTFIAEIVLQKKEPNISNFQSFYDNLSSYFGVIFSEPPENLPVFNTYTGSGLIGLWFIATLIFQTAYYGTLKATLSTISPNSIHNLEDLVKRPHIRPLIREKCFHEDFFSTAPPLSVHHKVWEMIEKRNGAVSWDVLQSSDSWVQVLNGKAVFIFDHIPMTYHMMKRDLRCNGDKTNCFYLAKDVVAWHSLTLAMRRTLPTLFKEMISQKVQMYAETLQLETSIRELQRGAMKYMWTGQQNSKTETLTNQHFSLLYQLYCAGILIAFFVFYGEQLTHRFSNYIRIYPYTVEKDASINTDKKVDANDEDTSTNTEVDAVDQDTFIRVQKEMDDLQEKSENVP